MSGTFSQTETTRTLTETQTQSVSPSVTLKLRKPKSDKKVNWKTGVVDNEHMGKKKSKCCCIYKKRRLFGESSSSSESESDDECKMCRKQQKANYNRHKEESRGEEGTLPQGAEGGE